MSDFVFLNVYSGCSPQAKGASSESSLWNVYLNEKENVYLIQKLDENNNPTSEKYKISPTFFGVNFRKANNVQLESKTKKNLIFVRSKDKTNVLTNASSAHAAAKNEKADKKRTGEFLIQLSANKPQAIQEKSDKAPKSNLSAKKATNEFQFNVNAAAPEKKKSVNDFGLSSLLNTLTQTNIKETSKPTLTISTQDINKSQTAKTSTPAAANAVTVLNSTPASNSETSTAAQTAQAIPTAKHIRNVINAETPAASEQDKKQAKTTDTSSQNKQIEKITENKNKLTSASLTVKTQPTETQAVKIQSNETQQTKAQPTAAQTAETQSAKTTQLTETLSANAQPVAAAKDTAPKDIITETEEALLQPKESDKEYKLSEKALKLDKSVRAEFQVSLTHWNCAKKNLATRHFHDILNRQADYVPAHKHMFTDFAIKLRKINLHDLALQYATKSTTLSPDDSHAFFNVARLYYELGRYEEAKIFVDKALGLENDLSPALRLSGIIKECIRRKAENK